MQEVGPGTRGERRSPEPARWPAEPRGRRGGQAVERRPRVCAEPGDGRRQTVREADRRQLARDWGCVDDEVCERIVGGVGRDRDAEAVSHADEAELQTEDGGGRGVGGAGMERAEGERRDRDRERRSQSGRQVPVEQTAEAPFFDAGHQQRECDDRDERRQQDEASVREPCRPDRCRRIEHGLRERCGSLADRARE